MQKKAPNAEELQVMRFAIDAQRRRAFLRLDLEIATPDADVLVC